MRTRPHGFPQPIKETGQNKNANMHLPEIVTEEAADVENETATQGGSGTVAITEVTGRQFHRVARHLLDGNECPNGRQ